MEDIINKYGWVVVAVLILFVAISFIPNLGSAVTTAMSGLVTKFTTTAGGAFSKLPTASTILGSK